tara:strand:- start:88 stop:327 length:240 start_codon:yes stop_codon:yes gene_type:complete
MLQYNFGQIAQSVEQRTENPRVGGSIPSLATFKKPPIPMGALLFPYFFHFLLIFQLLMIIQHGSHRYNILLTTFLGQRF